MLPRVFKKQWVQALGVLVGATLALLSPVLIGRVPLPTDILPSTLPIEGAPRFSDEAIFRDAIAQAYPYHEFTSSNFKAGHFPLWNPLIFAGTPFFANGQAGVLSPLKAFWWWLPAPTSFTLSVILQFLFGGFGMYLLGRKLGWRLLPSLTAAFVFILSGPFTLWSSTSIMSSVFAWLPWLILCTIGLHQTLRWRWTFGLAACVAGAMLSGQVQVGLISILAALGWTACTWQRYAWRKRLLMFGFAFALGLGLVAIQLVPVIEASQLAYRSNTSPRPNPTIKNLAALATTVWPDALGSTSTFHGPANYIEGNLFLGPIALLLIPFSLRYRRKRMWRIAAIGCLSFIVVLCFPGLKLLLDAIVPPLTLATVWRYTFLFTFCAAILAGYGISYIQQRTQRLISAGILALLLITTILGYYHVLPFGKRSELYPSTPLLTTLKQTTMGRLWSRDTDLNQFMPYGISTIGGYDSLYPKRYLELWQSNSTVVKQNQLTARDVQQNLLQITGANKLLTIQPLPTGWQEINRLGTWVIAKPKTNAPPFHTVNKILVSDNPAQLRDINVSTTALISKDLPLIDPNARTTVEILNQQAEITNVNVTTSGSTLFVTNLQYYPGWQTTVDGKNIPSVRVNYTFLGAAVPTGSHTVSFAYQPKSFRLGLLLSGLAIILTIGLGFFTYRKKLL